ncbi:MAG: hypothetical protein M0R51_16465 [Clostridia bacterium]|nr:hypothetical protein [Clostridia bacterium]
MFSCKAYDAESAAKFCKNYFEAGKVKYTSLLRD